jgi:hypothetical protein
MAVNTHIWGASAKAGRALVNRAQASIAQYAVHLRPLPEIRHIDREETIIASSALGLIATHCLANIFDLKQGARLLRKTVARAVEHEHQAEPVAE